MLDLDEALIGILDALLADAELTALLGAVDEIYREPPRTKLALPALTMICTADNPQGQFSDVGVWRPTLEIGVMADKQSTCRAIIAVLDQNWTIPERNTARIETANLKVTRLRRTGAVTVGPVKSMNTDQELFLVTTLWTCKVQPLESE